MKHRTFFSTKRRTRASAGALAALVAAGLLVVACSSSGSSTPTVTLTGTAPPAPSASATATTTPAGTPVAPTSSVVAGVPAAWTRVQFEGMSFEVPEGWAQQGTDTNPRWVAPSGDRWIAAATQPAGGGREPTSMLPDNAVSVSATPLTYPWADGMLHVVDILKPGSGGQVEATEEHAIMRLGSKADYDFSVHAPTRAALDAADAVLKHALASMHVENPPPS